MRYKLLVTLSIIILIVVYAYFGMGYMKEREEQAALTSQIADASYTLAQVPEPPRDLEQRLAVAQVSLAAEQDAFPGQINSTQIVNTILKLANDCEVKAIPLVTKPWSMEDIGEHGYYVFRLNVAVEGSFSQLVSFVGKLENGEFETLVVEDLSVTKVEEQPEGETVPEGSIPVTASLDLAIYTQSLTSR